MRLLTIVGVLLLPVAAHAACLPGAINLNQPCCQANNRYGLDGQQIAIDQSIDYCVHVASVVASAVTIKTADRTGSAQCSKNVLLCFAPDGTRQSSQATNNTIRFGTETGDYGCTVTGAGMPGCAPTFLIYADGITIGTAPTPGPTPTAAPTPRPTATSGCATPTPRPTGCP